MLNEIEQVLDEKVRPSLRLHGGDIEVLDFEDGILRFRFLGQCSGCPSAYLTTEQLVQEEVCAALPQVKQVVLVQQVSQSLLDQAWAILHHD
ncbi:MAG: NifU family protein [Candidatus Enterenecus sp.]